MNTFKPKDTQYQIDNTGWIPFYCAQTMFKFPWEPAHRPYSHCGMRVSVHPELDKKLVKRFINSINKVYNWNNVEITLQDEQLTCIWHKVPYNWLELYVLLTLIRLPGEHPYSLIQYQKIRDYTPRDVALAFCSCYNGYHIANHLLRSAVWHQLHLIDFSITKIISQSVTSCFTAIQNLYGPPLILPANVQTTCYQWELTPEWYKFFCSQSTTDFYAIQDKMREFVKKYYG